MLNTQSQTNFVIKIYGRLVNSITGKDEFECQMTSLPTPEISLPSTVVALHPFAGGRPSMKGQVPGNTLDNNDLMQAEILVDEEFKSYLFFAQWLTHHTLEKRDAQGDIDTTVEIVALNDRRKPLIVFTYQKVNPTMLSPVEMTSQLTDPGQMMLPVTMAYDSFRIKDPAGNIIV